MCNMNTVGLGLFRGNELSKQNEKLLKEQMQIEYQTRRNKAILDNLIQNSKELNNSYAMDYEENAAKRQEDYINNLQAKSTAQALMASKGLVGNSVENLYRGYDRALAVNNYLSARNLQTRGLYYNDKLNSLRKSAIDSIGPYYPAQYNFASTLLGSANRIFNDYEEYLNKNIKMDL